MRFYQTGVVDVTDEPQMVCTVPQDISTGLVRSDADVFIGGEEVDTEMGFPLKASDGPIPFPCFDSDSATLYAVAAQGETSAHVWFFISS